MIIVLAGPGLADLAPHDHLCFVYERDAEVRQALLEYVVAGLGRRERVCVYTMPDAVRGSIDADLRRAGVPLDELTGDGTLVFGSTEQLYLVDGAFDIDERLTAYADAALSAIDDGFTGLRAYSDSSFLLDHPQALAAWPEYELAADQIAGRLPITAMCGGPFDSDTRRE